MSTLKEDGACAASGASSGAAPATASGNTTTGMDISDKPLFTRRKLKTFKEFVKPQRIKKDDNNA